jgi:hypothetical protein
MTKCWLLFTSYRLNEENEAIPLPIFSLFSITWVSFVRTFRWNKAVEKDTAYCGLEWKMICAALSLQAPAPSMNPRWSCWLWATVSWIISQCMTVPLGAPSYDRVFGTRWGIVVSLRASRRPQYPTNDPNLETLRRGWGRICQKVIRKHNLNHRPGIMRLDKSQGSFE